MSYRVEFNQITAVDEKPVFRGAEEIHHTVYKNGSATSIRVEAKIADGVYVEVAAAQTDDYETYNLAGVRAWRVTPIDNDCSTIICGSVGV